MLFIIYRKKYCFKYNKHTHSLKLMRICSYKSTVLYYVEVDLFLLFYINGYNTLSRPFIKACIGTLSICLHFVYSIEEEDLRLYIFICTLTLERVWKCFCHILDWAAMLYSFFFLITYIFLQTKSLKGIRGGNKDFIFIYTNEEKKKKKKMKHVWS